MNISLLAPKNQRDTKRIYELLVNEFAEGDTLYIDSVMESYDEEAKNIAEYLGINIVVCPAATKYSDIVFIMHPNGYEMHLNQVETMVSKTNKITAVVSV